MKCCKIQWKISSLYIFVVMELETSEVNEIFCLKAAILEWYEGSWFVNYDEVLNFYDWILCYCEPFHGSLKKKRKPQSIFISLKFKSLWSLSHGTMLMFISYEYFQPWICWFCFYILYWFFPCCLKSWYE